MHKNHEIRYAWHPKTFECMGAVPSLIGEGVSPPDNTTALRPSIPEGCAAVWDAAASKWTYPEDHRGEQGWLCGASAIVKELGPLPAEWSTLLAKEGTITKEFS